MIISMKGDLGKFRPRSDRAVPQAIHGQLLLSSCWGCFLIKEYPEVNKDKCKGGNQIEEIPLSYTRTVSDCYGIFRTLFIVGLNNHSLWMIWRFGFDPSHSINRRLTVVLSFDNGSCLLTPLNIYLNIKYIKVKTIPYYRIKLEIFLPT